MGQISNLSDLFLNQRSFEKYGQLSFTSPKVVNLCKAGAKNLKKH